MFARGYFPGRSGQVFLVPKQGRFVTSHDPLYPFMHGSPWDYDTHIPLLLSYDFRERPKPGLNDYYSITSSLLSSFLLLYA